MVADTVRYGELVYRQGLKFYIAVRRNLRYIDSPDYSAKLENTVVVLSHYDEIITVYKNEKALRNIKRKSKQLLTNENS
jgi:hypothetical protein